MEMLNYMRKGRGSPVSVLHDVANDMSTMRSNVRQGDPPIIENKEQLRLPFDYLFLCVTTKETEGSTAFKI